MLSFDDLEPHLHFSNDTTYLVNFWASWCTPCVSELPAFESIREEYRDEKLKVLLVSLDFPGQVDTRLMPFLEKNGIRSEVLVLNDPDAKGFIVVFTCNGCPYARAYQDPAAVKEPYLANALDALLADREPDPSFTKAIGCTIKQQ